MLNHNWAVVLIEVVFVSFTIFLLLYYFDIFFERRNRKRFMIVGILIFVIWQLLISGRCQLPGIVNISITIIVTILTVISIYKGKLSDKCIFTISFNAIWMLMETFTNYILMIYCEQYADDQIIGSFMSKLFFGGVIAALRKVFSDDEIKNLPTRYSFMLVLIPLGSIYIMNNIFMLSYHMNDDNANVHSAITVLLLFGINILIFYVYVKLAEDLRLRRTNSVYEQQLELCERHQEERELSLLQVRDVRHNMKNNLVSILAYAENGECKKIIKFVNEIMEEGGMKTSRIINSGNIVIDSLINYWYITAQKEGIDFSIDINIPIRMPFKGADICLILGNLLENAVEAARKVERNKYIRIRMKYDKNNLLLYIVNNYSGELIKDKSNGYKSTKVDSENHGVGLASVHRTVAKYHGVVVTDDSMPEKFLVKVVLYETPK